jgi:hypothetical protein
MGTNVCISIIYVMDGIIAMMVVMNGIGTVVCIHTNTSKIPLNIFPHKF